MVSEKSEVKEYIMSDINVRLSEKSVRASVIGDVGAFLTTLANAIIAGISAGNIRFNEEVIICPTCGRQATEYTLTVLTQITWLFVLKLTVQIKALYDPACGLSYFRVKLV
jgi:hypothetical protein